MSLTSSPAYVRYNVTQRLLAEAFAYLKSRGAQTVNLDAFRTLPGSTATGSAKLKRLTKLKQYVGDRLRLPKVSVSVLLGGGCARRPVLVPIDHRPPARTVVTRRFRSRIVSRQTRSVHAGRTPPQT